VRWIWRPAHVTQRSTFGVMLSDRQAVQFMLADLRQRTLHGRLMLLHIAYKAEKGLDLTQENSIAKVFLAHMVHKVVDTAIPAARRARLQPGYDSGKVVHPESARSVWSTAPTRCTNGGSGRNVIKAYKKHGTTASAAGGDLI